MRTLDMGYFWGKEDEEQPYTAADKDERDEGAAIHGCDKNERDEGGRNGVRNGCANHCICNSQMTNVCFSTYF